MKSQDLAEKVDTDYLGFFTAYNLERLRLLLSPTLISFQTTPGYAKVISKRTGDPSRGAGGVYPLFGALSVKKGERPIFTFYILTAHLSLYKIWKGYGIQPGTFTGLKQLVIPLTCEFRASQEMQNLLVTTSQSTFASLILETEARIKTSLGGYGEDGTYANQYR